MHTHTHTSHNKDAVPIPNQQIPRKTRQRGRAMGGPFTHLLYDNVLLQELFNPPSSSPSQTLSQTYPGHLTLTHKGFWWVLVGRHRFSQAGGWCHVSTSSAPIRPKRQTEPITSCKNRPIAERQHNKQSNRLPMLRSIRQTLWYILSKMQKHS